MAVMGEAGLVRGHSLPIVIPITRHEVVFVSQKWIEIWKGCLRKSYHPIWPPTVYVKVKRHFTAEVVRV